MKTTHKTTSARKTAVKKTNEKSSRETLEDVFENLLKDVYWAEKHLAKALPKMAKASLNEELIEAFEAHTEDTKLHVTRIEECFSLINLKPTAKKCEAMEGLIKEGEEAIANYSKGHARDAALIAAVQKAEHYEISAYGTLRTMATVLGNIECAQLLEETKDEEAEADIKLTTVAAKINQLAAEGVEEEEEEEEIEQEY